MDDSDGARSRCNSVIEESSYTVYIFIENRVSPNCADTCYCFDFFFQDLHNSAQCGPYEGFIPVNSPRAPEMQRVFYGFEQKQYEATAHKSYAILGPGGGVSNPFLGCVLLRITQTAREKIKTVPYIHKI